MNKDKHEPNAIESLLFLLFVMFSIYSFWNISNGAIETMKYLLVASLAYEMHLFFGAEKQEDLSLWKCIKLALLKNYIALTILILICIYNIFFGSSNLAKSFGFMSYFYAQVVYSFSQEDSITTLISLFITQMLLLNFFISGGGMPFMPIIMMFL